MESRTIATVGGGDLVIGRRPAIEGLLHGWIYKEGTRGVRGGYGFILGVSEAHELVGALRSRESIHVKTFSGTVCLSWGTEREDAAGVACLWFYTFGGARERGCQLYEGAIEAAANALVEACKDAVGGPR
jgi:hypothetical protein